MNQTTPENPLETDQFVGEAPAGDASPGEFMSNDQSTGSGS
jgi:hypothetical protein